MFPSLYGVVSQGAAAASWWVVAGKTCVAAYQPIGAASLAASYVNLANPGTYDAAPGVAPTWASATGWTFNGTDQWLTTGLQVSHPTTIIVRVTRFAGHYFPIIVQDGYRNAPGAGIAIWNFNGWFAGNYGLRASIYIGTLAYPYTLAVQAGNFYVDSVSVGNPGSTWMPSGNLEIGRGYFIDLSVMRYGAPIITAVAIYSDTLSGAEVATVSAAMAALT